MEFIYVKAGEFKRFAGKYAAGQSGVVPITPWRAAGQANNPWAKEEDVLMIVSVDENKKIRGYIGILPVHLHHHQNTRVYYNTCWWADPVMGGVASFQLFLHFLQYTSQRVIFSDLTEKTRRILEQTGNFSFKERRGAIIRLRPGLKERARRVRGNGIRGMSARIFAKSGLAFLADAAGNRLHASKISGFLSEGDASLSTGSHALPSPEMEKFILDHTQPQDVFIPRRQDAVWWSDYPWLIPETADKQKAGERYFFSAYAGEFHYSWQEIFEAGKRIGTACLSFRDGLVKTLYLWYEEGRKQHFFRALFRNVLADPKNHSLVSFHEEFINYLDELQVPHIHWEWKMRHTAVSAEIEKLTGKNWKMQDGDGDYVFT